MELGGASALNSGEVNWRCERQAVSRVRLPALPLCFYAPASARALFSRAPARAPRASPPASRAFPTRLDAFSIRFALIKRSRAFRRAPKRAQRLIERLPSKRDVRSKFSV
jgi:hypothetical protein